MYPRQVVDEKVIPAVMVEGHYLFTIKANKITLDKNKENSMQNDFLLYRAEIYRH